MNKYKIPTIDKQASNNIQFNNKYHSAMILRWPQLSGSAQRFNEDKQENLSFYWGNEQKDPMLINKSPTT